MITRAAQQRALGIIEQAVQAGAMLLLDGTAPAAPKGCEGGFWLGPTVLHLGDARTAEANIAWREEIFGPVQCIVEVETAAEATALVNRNAWGNGCAIFTGSGASARAFVEEVEAGQVGVNVPIPVPLPFFSFTGNKRSHVGNAHFYGPGGVDFATQTKTITSSWRASEAASTGGGSPLTMPTPGR